MNFFSYFYDNGKNQDVPGSDSDSSIKEITSESQYSDEEIASSKSLERTLVDDTLNTSQVRYCASETVDSQSSNETESDNSSNGLPPDSASVESAAASKGHDINLAGTDLIASCSELIKSKGNLKGVDTEKIILNAESNNNFKEVLLFSVLLESLPDIEKNKKLDSLINISQHIYKEWMDQKNIESERFKNLKVNYLDLDDSSEEKKEMDKFLDDFNSYCEKNKNSILQEMRTSLEQIQKDAHQKTDNYTCMGTNYYCGLLFTGIVAFILGYLMGYTSTGSGQMYSELFQQNPLSNDYDMYL